MQQFKSECPKYFIRIQIAIDSDKKNQHPKKLIYSANVQVLAIGLNTFAIFRKKVPHVCVSMGNTNLDFVNPGGLWAHQATIQHPIS